MQLAEGLQLYASLYYVPLYFSAVRGYGPTRTGASILPTTVSLVPASVIVGVLITRFGKFRSAIWAGWAIATLGHGLSILWDANTNTASWAAILVLVGLGHGLTLNAQNFATQAIALPGDEALAASMYAFTRSFGMALGVGIGGSVFQNVAIIRLRENGLSEDIAKEVETWIEIIWSPDLSKPPPEEVAQILDAFTYGLHGVFGVLCAAAGVAGLASLLVRHFDLDKALVSKHHLVESDVAKKLQRLSRHSRAAEEMPIDPMNQPKVDA